MGFEVFTAQVESGRGATTIVLSGELDMATAPILEEHLVRAESDLATTILVDLRELTFVDSTGLHAFLSARSRAETNGRELLLIGAKAPVRRVFELTGQDLLLSDETVASVLQGSSVPQPLSASAQGPAPHGRA